MSEISLINESFKDPEIQKDFECGRISSRRKFPRLFLYFYKFSFLLSAYLNCLA